MLFVGLGLLLIAMKLGDVMFVAEWSWWTVLSPFVAAAVWWAYADSSGLTKRREMDKLDLKRLERRRKNMAALGTGRDNQKAAGASARAREAAAKRVEAERAQKRQHNERIVKDSVFDSRTGEEFAEPHDSSKPLS